MVSVASITDINLLSVSYIVDIVQVTIARESTKEIIEKAKHV